MSATRIIVYGDSIHSRAWRTVPRDRIAPVPAYDTSAMAALDEAIVEAMERAYVAEEDPLAHVLW
jgi:hypothetical protein